MPREQSDTWINNYHQALQAMGADTSELAAQLILGTGYLLNSPGVCTPEVIAAQQVAFKKLAPAGAKFPTITV